MRRKSGEKVTCLKLKKTAAMFLTEAGCLLFNLYISGVQGQTNSVCALKGSSVSLSCSAGDSAADKEYKWFTVFLNGSKKNFGEVIVDGNQKKYRTSEESRPSLTINDLNKSDERLYFCCESADKQDSCSGNQTQLYVGELQVKVFPSKDGQTVSLMCSSSSSSSSSCPFTQKFTGFIWFKNRQILYQDLSPWYQELVSGEEAVTYSCAVKGQEDFRAPEVSVDLVTSACFRVTFAERSMCSSGDKQCSIMFPTEIFLHQTPAEKDHVKLTCSNNNTVVFKNRKPEKRQITVPITSADSFTCAMKDLKDFHSVDVCVDNSSCWTVNCLQKRICALQGSSLNISCNYSHPRDQQPKSKLWFKINKNINQEEEEMQENKNKVTFYDKPNQHNLGFKKLSKNNSGEYVFRIETNSKEWKESTFPEVTLIVTDLRVEISPSAEVTEGQKVTLTCSTSCPLTHSSNFHWYLNRQPLKLENKQLVIDSVLRQNTGNYSCVVKSKEQFMSTVETLTVKSNSPTWKPFVGGVSATVFVSIICLAVFLWIRKKKASTQLSRSEAANNLEKLNPDHLYEEIPAQPAEVHCSQVNLENTFVYSTIQPHQEQDHVPYAITKFQQNSDMEIVNGVI